MIAHRSFENSAPLTWVGRFPVYATTIIVALNVVSMVAVAFVGIAQSAAWFGFNTHAVLRDFQIYRCLTYAFVHAPDPWFILELVMLYIFGRDVEAYLGRLGFLRLYAGFLLLGPALLLVASAATGQSLSVTNSWANFAMFLAFASLYPNDQLLFQITAKIFAWIFLSISFLQLIAMRQVSDMLTLLATAALAWYAIRRTSLSTHGLLARLRPLLRPRRSPRLRLVPREEETDPEVNIDPLLEKISRSGLSSLTPRERRQLERARTALLQRDKAKHS